MYSCLPRHLGDCLSQTPASSSLLIRQTLNMSLFTIVKPALQLNLASELRLLPSVSLTDPSAGAGKGGQLMSVNKKHVS